MLVIQYNSLLSTRQYKAGEFTKSVKSTITPIYNQARYWSKIENSQFKTHIDFYQELIKNLFAYRFGCKVGGNKKANVIPEIHGIAIDLDKTNASVEKTLRFAKDFNSIFYYSPNGDPSKDNTPHRLILFFDKPQLPSIAEKYSKQISKYLQDEIICFDVERLWFPPMPHTVHLSQLFIGKGIESIPLNDSEVDITVKKSPTKDKAPNTIELKTGIRNHINKALTTKALEIGFNEFFKLVNISDCVIKESRRSPENSSSKIEGQSVKRFDVKPPSSDSFDRVDCNLIDDILYFYDRRDGLEGFTGTFLKFLLICSGESPNDCNFESQINYSKELFTLLGLSFPEKPKKIEPAWLWCEFLNDYKEELIFIDDCQKYGLYNGKYWELINPEKLFRTTFIEWTFSVFGIVKASILSQIKSTLVDITYGKIKTFKTKPIDRYLYGFNDVIYNSTTKEVHSFSPNFYIWYVNNYNYYDLDTEKGKLIWDKLSELVEKIIIGDNRKHNCFLNGFALLALDSLWRSQSMMWLYGEGGSGKSTLVNWLRDMVGNAGIGGRMVDLRSQEIFNSPHSLQKVIDGSIINLSEFSFPSKNDSSFLKDIIASGATENSNKIKGGCAIPINEKFKNPYTAFWYGSVVATSQDKPKNDCILDSGWQRRLNFFNFRKIKENTNIFKEIDAGLNDLFVYILTMDVELLLSQYNDYFRTPDPEQEQQQELELSPVAGFLNDNTEISNTPVSIRSLYLEFNQHKVEYGMPISYNLSLSQFSKYLERYLSKFYDESIYIHDKTRCCNLSLKVAKLRGDGAKFVTTSNNSNFNF